MQPRPTKLTIKVKGKVHEIITSSVHNPPNTIEKTPVKPNEPNIPSNEDNEPQNQLVLYNHSLNDTSKAITPVPNPINSNKPRSKPVPVIGTFTVQCAKCFKWRLIPDQDMYEKIRENITTEPFLCETTRQWHREVSCDDPTDIEQDGTRIWAIDKPDIAKPPPGWKRLLRIRSKGSTRFADVYYMPPEPGKKQLRSMPEVEKFLLDNPELAEGITPKQFSFQVPKPLSDNYVRKRSHQTPGSFEPSPAEPLAWAGPDENPHVQIVEPISWAGPEENGPYTKTPENKPVNPAAKKAKYSFESV